MNRLYLLAAVISATAASAQDPRALREAATDDLVGFEGNWQMEFTNRPEKGKTDRQFISIARTWEWYCNGVPFSPSRQGAPAEGGNWVPRRVLKSKFRGTGEFGEHEPPAALPWVLKHNYGFLGYWGGQSELAVAGPDEVRGTWKYGDKESGQQVWRRVFPQITEIEMKSQITDRVRFGEAPVRVVTTYSGPGNDMRGNRSGFEIRVFGDNLWGHHVCWIEGTDLEPGYPRHIVEKGSGKTHDVTGLRLEVNIWSKASPGKKILHVDDIQIPFELVVKNFPEDQKPPAPELRFVRLVNGKFEPVAELRHGDEFCVEARYNKKPPQPPGKVQLSWTDGAPREVEVKPTDDAQLFRSAVMKLEPPQPQ